MDERQNRITVQKLVTIYLSTKEDKDTAQQEHLEEYLADRWLIKSITPIGVGGGDSFAVKGWMAVLLTKDVVEV